MRHLIIRRKVRIILLFILLTAVFSSVMPWIYKNLLSHGEDFLTHELPSQVRNFPSFMSSAGLGKEISMDFDFLNDDYVFSRCRLKGLRLKNFRLSGDVIIKGHLLRDRDGAVTGFSGKLFSDGISLNSKLSLPVAMLFTFTKGEFNIKSLTLGDSYELKGEIGLIKPFETNLVFNINRGDIRDLTRFAKVKSPGVVLGMINGSIRIRGHLGSIFSNGVIESRNGRLGPIRYDVATLRLEGFGPIINIVDSILRYGNGMLTMDGSVDLRDIGKGTVLDGLKVRSDFKTIVWEGWEINKRGADELTMTKDINDSMRVGFKTIAENPLTTYYDKQNPEEMSLEYKMGLEDLKIKLRNDEEFFVIEHSVRF